MAWIREGAEVTIGDVACKLYREGIFSGAFVLEAGGFPLVQAVKPSALLRSFDITYDETHRYTLRARTIIARTFDLLHDGQVVGTIYPDHAFTRKMTAELPEELPLAVQVFMIWLVILLWKRAAQSSS
jgi:hypothetical protein